MRRLFVSLALLLGLTDPDSAQTARMATPSNATQTTITDIIMMQAYDVPSIAQPNSSISGKTSVCTAPCTISTNTFVWISVGQSINSNSVPTPRTPVNATVVQQVNLYDSTVYRAVDPLVGTGFTSGGNYNTYLGDKLVADGKFARVILFPIALGGSTALDWSPSGVLNQRARVACWTIRRMGWIGNVNVKFGIGYDDGQTDANIVGTSQANWQARYQAFRDSMTGYGCNFDTFVAISTRQSNATNATIQAAQAAVVDGVKTFTGANTDGLTATGSNLQGDGTHLSDAGASNNANLWATIIEAHY